MCEISNGCMVGWEWSCGPCRARPPVHAKYRRTNEGKNILIEGMRGNDEIEATKKRYRTVEEALLARSRERKEETGDESICTHQ